MTHDDDARVKSAVELAESLLEDSLAELSRAERRRRQRIGALVQDEASRSFMLQLTDQVLRIRTTRRAALRLQALVAAFPRPAVAGPADRLALQAASALAPVAPGVVVRLATARLRRELAGLVLPVERAALRRHLRRRRREGMRLNVNLLGEAILGERQAGERARLVAELLARPEIGCVSVKLSALYSQLDVVAYEESLEAARNRLRPILEVAARARPKKLVNLDMEEYRDLHLTVDVFCSLLREDRFSDLCCGLALQAYLPDSVPVLERLCAFARERYATSGSPVRVRLVKGANLAMERVEAELCGWHQAPFPTKEEVDANYKRLLDIALRRENDGALRVGVASHNLFDVAWALGRAEETEPSRVEIEMLEGMAPTLAKVVARRAGGVLLYAPVVGRDDFESAVAYLVRRFDENTAPENFLAHLSSLTPSSPAWEEQRRRFEGSVSARLLAPGPPRRVAQLASEGTPELSQPAFVNAPDTDFAVASNREVLAATMADVADPVVADTVVGGALAELEGCVFDPVPAVVDGQTITGPLTGQGVDPSDPGRVLYRYVEADLTTVERAVEVAREAATRWREMPADERGRLLSAAAEEMERDRARSIALMMRDGGKVVREADGEVSEAVDYARYYAERALLLESHHGPSGRFSPFGVVVVASPWNFPYAIPAGGIFAALAAGNATILKPAPETVLTASRLVEACHRAGIPADVLQFLPLADSETGRRLVTHESVSAVVLTGAFDTARQFLSWRPTLVLHAETSGKNAIVVTAAADQEDAVRDLVHSAFSHAGQKCSAASLGILEASVYADPAFRARLKDAVASLPVGPATDPSTRVGPLIRPPQGALLRQLTTLSTGESWLVEPRQVGNNPNLWSPGVKLGVAPGSELHLVECFGPVLGLMRAADLEEAITLQNATPYGLTGGISSLDDGDVARWRERVQVGNAYVNRHITGAIVRRQPFGGWKCSAVGPGRKAGGPNYLASLGRWSSEVADVTAEREHARVLAATLLCGVDPSGLVAERNVFRLRPLGRAVLRLGAPPDEEALSLSLAVAQDLGVDVEISIDALAGEEVTRVVSDARDKCGSLVSTRRESLDVLVERLGTEEVTHVRVVHTDPGERLRLLDAGAEVDVEPLVALGTYELLRWTREQALSTTAHRHGNVVRDERPEEEDRQ